MKQLPRAQIILQSTGAIGDTVIATALIPALNAVSFDIGHICSKNTFSLWQGLDHAYAYKSEASFPPYAVVVSIRDYQFCLPHTIKPFRHLCEYMRLQLVQRLAGQEIYLSLPKVSCDDVKLRLSSEEWLWGQHVVKQFSQAHGGKPVIILAPCASTINRSLDPFTVAEVVEKLRKFSVPVLLDPLPPAYCHLGIERLGSSDLRKVAALLGVVDGFIGVDSGPFHLAVAARQGITQNIKDMLKVKASLQSIILIAGSSHPAVVSYSGVQEVRAKGGCPIAPCGMHGYDDIQVRRKEFGRSVYTTPKDTSGCIYPEYSYGLTTKCMSSVSVDQVVSAAKYIKAGQLL
ncbi:MAG TPA: glycosyltransferase family 9 protein [Ktedonobacteraceae bacterium]|jgi:hypothetical protein